MVGNLVARVTSRCDTELSDVYATAHRADGRLIPDLHDMRVAAPPGDLTGQPPGPAEGRGRAKAEVREKLRALHRELGAGLRVFAAYAVVSWIRDWLDDGPTTRQASTVESYRRLAGHAIGEPGAVKLKDLTARQVHKALGELPASLPARSLRPPVLTARLTRSLAHGEQLHWQPAADRRRRSLRSRVCLARPQPCLPT
jgi:hypothetical protein